MKTLTKLIGTALFGCLCISAASQSADTLNYRRVRFTTSLFEYIPNFVNTGNINFGVELALNSKSSVSGNMGYITSYGPSKGFFSINAISTKGFRVQIEGRRYLNARKMAEPAMLVLVPHILQYNTQTIPLTGYYFAAHSSIQQTNTLRTEYVADAPNARNEYEVSRSAVALNLKFGYQCIKRSGIVVDFSIGAGVQFIGSTSNGKIDDTVRGHDKELFRNKQFDSGKGVYPSFVYQLKVGF